MFNKLNHLLSLAVLCLALSACDNAFKFNEILSDCEPPKSSARYGKNSGPVITSPDAYTPSKGTQIISGTCVDGLEVDISGDGISTEGTIECVNGQFSTTVTYAGGDGNKEVDVSQKTSKSGGSIMDRLCFQKDTTPPKVTIKEKSSTQAIGKKSTTLNGTCESGLMVEISGPDLDGTVITDCRNGKFKADVKFNGNDGIKNVIAKQVDRAGNSGDDDQDYLTDTTAPVVRIESPSDLSYTTGTVIVNGSCESDLDVILQGTALQRPLKTNCLSSKFSATINVKKPDGAKQIIALQTDAAGNTGQDIRNIVLDSKGPQLTIDQPAQDYTKTRDVTMAGECEPGLVVRLSGTGLDRSETTSCPSGKYSEAVRLTNGDGSKSLVASQTDAANNTATVTKTIVLDTRAPVVAITSPTENTLVKNNVKVSGQCESDLDVELSGSGVSKTVSSKCKNSSFSATVHFTKDDGKKEIVVTQTDLAGNVGSDDVSVLRDETAPAIMITSPVNGTATTGALTLKGVCESNLKIDLSGHITVEQIDCRNGRFEHDVVLTGAIGSKTVTAAQTDANGNRGFDTNSYRKVNNMGELSFTSLGPEGKVDILFIDDNSGSMEQDQKRLGDRFSSFAIELKDYDWQAAITTTDCDTTSNFNICGSFLDFAGTNDYILTKDTPNFLDAFQKTIQRPETYDPSTGTSCLVTMSCPSTFETPLLAAMEAMDKRNSDNRGFFRDKSDLAIVVLSDEDEHSNMRSQDVINHFKRIWSKEKKLQAYGIIIEPNDKNCQKKQGKDSKEGKFIKEFTQDTGGFTESICDTDYTLALRRIGENVTKLNRTVELQHTPIKGTVKVSYSPAWDTKYVVENNKVIFDEPAPKGTEVTITYEY